MNVISIHKDGDYWQAISELLMANEKIGIHSRLCPLLMVVVDLVCQTARDLDLKLVKDVDKKAA